MNRGNRREDIFLTDQDRKVFVDGLADSFEIYHIILITYVLIANHFHLLVQAPQANLSEFMRHFLVTYAVRFNRRNGRTGHVLLSKAASSP
jgi:REP element-mobilizing transposase RayT